MYFKLLIWSLTACLAWQCGGRGQAAPKSDSGFRTVKFYLRFLESTRQVYAEAIFERDSGGLKLPDAVLLNGDAMRITQLPKIGYRYQAEFRLTESLSDTLVFEYLLTEGGSREQRRLVLPRLPGIDFPNRGFTKTNGGPIAWNGEPCSDDEALIVRLTDSGGNSFNINHLGKTRGNRFEVLDAHLKSARPGNLRVALTRRRTQTEVQGQTKFILLSEYYTEEFETTLVE